jgi:hypothetical protein
MVMNDVNDVGNVNNVTFNHYAELFPKKVK